MFLATGVLFVFAFPILIRELNRSIVFPISTHFESSASRLFICIARSRWVPPENKNDN